MIASDSAGPEVPTVIYDGECRVCSFFARLVARADLRQQLTILPFQSSTVGALLGRLTREEIERSVHLVMPQGRIVSGGEAVHKTLALLLVVGPVHRDSPTSGPIGKLVSALYSAGVAIRGVTQCRRPARTAGS